MQGTIVTKALASGFLRLEHQAHWAGCQSCQGQEFSPWVGIKNGKVNSVGLGPTKGAGAEGNVQGPWDTAMLPKGWWWWWWKWCQEPPPALCLFVGPHGQPMYVNLWGNQGQQWSESTGNGPQGKLYLIQNKNPLRSSTLPWFEIHTAPTLLLSSHGVWCWQFCLPAGPANCGSSKGHVENGYTKLPPVTHPLAKVSSILLKWLMSLEKILQVAQQAVV